MKHFKLLAIVICLFSIFALAGTAGAWSWWGFSSLEISDTVRGPEGSTITFELNNVVIYTQCYNENTDNQNQPGVGNAGGITLTPDVFADPSKSKGIITVKGTLDLAIWDKHYDDDGNIPDNHVHTCWPLDNVNKVELEDSAWISEFVANWVWKDEKGKIINSGTDTCTWTGEITDGFPEHGAAFDCASTSDKKINYVVVPEE